VILLDTHVLIWWVSGVQPLSTKARRALNQALRHGPARASAISAMEITAAVRRGRLSLGVPVSQWLAKLRELPDLLIEPVSMEIAELAGGFGEPVPGDPGDRIILATAQSLGCALVTADARLRQAGLVQTVW